MEPRFGHDFSRVRVHTDARANASARAVNALAYTVGQHVVFGSGEYAPRTRAGEHLIAHELAHVLQQQHSSMSGQAAPATVTRDDSVTQASDLQIGSAEDALERDAEEQATSVLGRDNSGRSGAVASRPRADAGLTLRRQEGDDSQPSQADEAQGARLRRLAAFPQQALAAWKRLGSAERSFVIMVMTGRYGTAFALDFTNYATGKKRPNPDVLISNTDTPKTLQSKGYRFAGDVGGTPIWVHPSGHEVHLMSGGSPSEGPGPEDDDAFQKRCVTPCLLDSEDEDDCNDCCDTRISSDDAACMKACKAGCTNKL
jgi:hypothetical protein